MPERAFPSLAWDDYLPFPEPETATEEGIVASGANLSPGVLLSAYRQGCFPWYSEDSPILWWNPDPRFGLYPHEFHLSESLRRFLKKSPFTVTFDQAFPDVIHGCRAALRPNQNGTWITDAVEKGYTELFRLGFAHSVEVWETGVGARTLVGGLYGVLLGRVFFGESMFHLRANASKVGFAAAFEHLIRVKNVKLIDCQVRTEYLASFGAHDLPRSEFMEVLKREVEFPGDRSPWTLS